MFRGSHNRSRQNRSAGHDADGVGVVRGHRWLELAGGNTTCLTCLQQWGGGRAEEVVWALGWTGDLSLEWLALFTAWSWNTVTILDSLKPISTLTFPPVFGNSPPLHSLWDTDLIVSWTCNTCIRQPCLQSRGKCFAAGVWQSQVNWSGFVKESGDFLRQRHRHIPQLTSQYLRLKFKNYSCIAPGLEAPGRQGATLSWVRDQRKAGVHGGRTWPSGAQTVPKLRFNTHQSQQVESRGWHVPLDPINLARNSRCFKTGDIKLLRFY